MTSESSANDPVSTGDADASVVVAKPDVVPEESGPITILGCDLVGLVFALFFFAWSLSPSRLPRDWVFQGIVSGVTSVTGYGVGLVFAFPVRRWVRPRFPWWRMRFRIELVPEIAVALLAVFTVISTVLVAANWQRDVDGLMGMSSASGVAYVRSGLIIVAIFLSVLLIARRLRRTARAIARLLSARLHLPMSVAHVIAPIAVAAAGVIFVDQVLLAGSSNAARIVFGGQNNGTEHGVVQPIHTERSGSSGSAAKWDTLGLQGRTFVAGGLSAARLASLGGTPAREPIRVYAGLGSATDTAARVNLIVDELDRTGAWDRKILVVVAMGRSGRGPNHRVDVQPDWLTENPGSDRTPAMRWYPIITFWQVTADLVRAQSPPPGHGHNYQDVLPYAWAAIAAPAGWTSADTDRVAGTLASLRSE